MTTPMPAPAPRAAPGGAARRCRLGELAVDHGYLTQHELDALLARAGDRPPMATGELLIRERLLTLSALGELLAEQRRRRGQTRAPAGEVGPGGATLEQLLARAGAAGGHELLLLAGRPPAVRRLDDALVLVPDPPLDAATVERFADEACLGQGAAPTFTCAAGRFRATRGRSIQGPSLTLRRIGLAPGQDGLSLPAGLEPLAALRRGLVIVAGARPALRASALAKLVERIAATSPRHVIVIDREPRHEFTHARGLVAERIIGVHTRSYEQALRSTLREDPDVLAVGELHGAEAIATALLSAETGHLVLCSFHAATPAHAIRHLTDGQGPARRDLARATLAGCLQAVVIVDAVTGRGGARHLVADVLPGTSAVTRLIREDQLHQLPAPQAQAGGVSRDAAIRALLQAGAVSRAAALEACADPAALGGRGTGGVR